ncbi:MAG: hypothetical protein UR73_C0001G0009 [candidate division WS6 bacterium GW2011_GWF1_35_23]|uniref:Uncharacterized protein n=1 Tax=candidate division WS6 bacterium GW2011_GWF1_35_23 TaxID=1619097 RepID=A0A0G0C9G5_9BACT|nr:MAG: hypothetical protein UR73_C0001G0009 [candidate division WS6 bacterium GW2011_GWF1_35_23]
MFASFLLENNVKKDIQSSIGVLGYKNISFHQIVLPAFNNIQSNFDSSFSYNNGAGLTLITLPDSFIYRNVDLQIFLETQLQLSDPNFTVSISDYTNLLTITNTVNFSMTDCFFLQNFLGFESGDIDGTTITYTATSPINYFPFLGYYVYSPNLKTKIISETGNNYSFFIPSINSGYYDYRSIEVDKKNLIYYPKKIISENFSSEIKIIVKLLRMDGEISLIDFSNNKIFISFKFKNL